MISMTRSLLILAMYSMNVLAAANETVVDVPSGTHMQRFLYVHPNAPSANIVFLPGGDGVLNIQDDGTMPTVVGSCSPFARVRQDLADRGFAMALVDENSLHEPRTFGDIVEVIRYMQSRDNVPTWIAGGSASTGMAMVTSSDLPAESPVGVIVFSPAAFTAAKAALVTRPILIVYNPLDIPLRVTELFNDLTSATIKSTVALNGGNSGGCGHHLFEGQEAEFVAATAGFIDQYNGVLGSSPIMTVVEYHHAAFDHYFITPTAGDIALLDAKTPPFQDWSRTGFTFNAYANATAPTTSVAICRFFNDHFAPKSSHFYAAHGFGCEDTLTFFPDWVLENGKLFNTLLPDSSGSCPAATIPVYRLYNRGMGGAPNHRFVTSLSERQKMIDLGFVPEGNGIGVAMCVPGP